MGVGRPMDTRSNAWRGRRPAGAWCEIALGAGRDADLPFENSDCAPSRFHGRVVTEAAGGGSLDPEAARSLVGSAHRLRKRGTERVAHGPDRAEPILAARQS